MRKKSFVIYIFLFVVISKSFSQVDPLLFQQVHNRELYNPAVIGKGGDIKAALSYRQQWVGFTGMSTQSLYLHGFASSLYSGFGLKAVFDGFGPLQTKNIKFNYSFFVPFGDVAFLGLGAGFGIMNNSCKGGDYFYARDAEDPSLPLENTSKTFPDFDFGFEFNTRNFEIGASSTHITYSYKDQILVRPMRNYYAYSRVKLSLNKAWDFIPGISWQYNRKSNTYELNAGIRYNNNLYVNVAYRNPMDLGMAVGLILFDGFRLTYSYDYGFDNLSTLNNGSHEITISYTIPVNTTYIKNKLRFFKWKMY